MELCSLLPSTPQPLLALICTLDCSSTSLVQLHFSPACVCERDSDWLGDTGADQTDGIEMKLRGSGWRVGKIRLQK